MKSRVSISTMRARLDIAADSKSAGQRSATDRIKLVADMPMPAARAPHINAERLWSSLMELARIGATPKGGVRRVTLTPVDRDGRERFARWCREAGLEVRVDAIGNMFARREGADR